MLVGAGIMLFGVILGIFLGAALIIGAKNNYNDPDNLG